VHVFKFQETFRENIITFFHFYNRGGVLQNYAPIETISRGAFEILKKVEVLRHLASPNSITGIMLGVNSRRAIGTRAIITLTLIFTVENQKHVNYFEYRKRRNWFVDVSRDKLRRYANVSKTVTPITRAQRQLRV